jgi:hypothetical protein
VISKYYPPDFDPSKLPPKKKATVTNKNPQTAIRVMLPFSVQCLNCGTYIFKGKKFNAKKEDSLTKYLTIKIWRFIFRCTACLHPISFLTDPQNSDYKLESGAKRNAEQIIQEEQKAKENEVLKIKNEEDKDSVKAVENKIEKTRREMEILDALEEIKERNELNNRFKQNIDLGSLIVDDEDDNVNDETIHNSETALPFTIKTNSLKPESGVKTEETNDAEQAHIREEFQRLRAAAQKKALENMVMEKSKLSAQSVARPAESKISAPNANPSVNPIASSNTNTNNSLSAAAAAANKSISGASATILGSNTSRVIIKKRKKEPNTSANEPSKIAKSSV